jgi:hypothetical protein
MQIRTTLPPPVFQAHLKKAPGTVGALHRADKTEVEALVIICEGLLKIWQCSEIVDGHDDLGMASACHF